MPATLCKAGVPAIAKLPNKLRARLVEQSHVMVATSCANMQGLIAALPLLQAGGHGEQLA